MLSNSIKPIAFIGLVLFAISLVFLSHVYACLTLAFILAYLLDPAISWAEDRGLPRSFGAPIALVVCLTALIFTGVAVAPKIAGQGRELLSRLPLLYHGVTARLGPVSNHYLGYNAFEDVDQLVDGFSDPNSLVKPLGSVVQNLFSQTLHAVTFVLGLFVIPLLGYYLLIDFPHLYEKFLYIVPKRHHKMASDIRTRLSGVLGGFLRGQLVVSSVLSVYYILALSILHLKLSLVLGLMAGFFNVIPYLGIGSVIVLTFLIAALNGVNVFMFYAALAVVFGIGVVVEGTLLTPRIVGRRVGLRPLTLILALLVGGELLGLVGMLLAVPIAAILKVFLDILLTRYRESEAFKR